MRRGLLRIAFFTGRKEKRLPDARDEGCTCIDMQVVHNVPEYAAKFLRPHNLKNRVSVYMEREVRDALAGYREAYRRQGTYHCRIYRQYPA